MQKRFNICTVKEYEGRDGQVKKFWPQVGKYSEYTKPDGTVSRFIELFMFPDVKFYIFAEKPKNAPNSNEYNQDVTYPQKGMKSGYMPETGQTSGSSSDSGVGGNGVIEYPEDDEINPEDIPF